MRRLTFLLVLLSTLVAATPARAQGWLPTTQHGGVIATGCATVGDLASGCEVVGLLFHKLPTTGTGFLEWNGTAWVFGSSGSSVAWANDLAGSTDSAQYVAAISGNAGSGGAVDVGATVTLTALAGTGGLSLGAWTGATALPTGNLSWAGATGKTLSLVGPAAFTLTGGASSTWSLTSGTLQLDAPTLDISPTGTTLGIGNSSSTTNILGTLELHTQQIPAGTANGQLWQFNGTNWALVSPGSLSTVTWADDLSGSSNTAQYVAAISGSGGVSGAVAVNGASTTLNWTSNAITLQHSATTAVQLGGSNSDFVTFGGNGGSNGFVRSTAGRDALDSPGALEIGTASTTGIGLGNSTTTTSVSAVVTNSGTFTDTVGATNVRFQGLSTGDFISLGSSPGSVGYVRCGDNATCIGSAGNSILSSDSTPNFTLNSPNTLYLASATTKYLQIASGDVSAVTPGVTLGVNGAFGSSFFGATAVGGFYQSIESITGTADNQVGHIREKQAVYEQTTTGTVTAASGAAGTLFCPPSNAAYQVYVEWSARAPNSSTPTGSAGGRTWASCINSGSTASCGTNQADTTSTVGTGGTMCGITGSSPPSVSIASGSGGCFIVQVTCTSTLDVGDIDYDFDIKAIHN